MPPTGWVDDNRDDQSSESSGSDLPHSPLTMIRHSSTQAHDRPQLPANGALTCQTQLEEDELTSSSAARQALRGNLDQSVTLTRKASWFGSARGVIQRSALQAKGLVDALRGDSKNQDIGQQEKEDGAQSVQDEEESIGQLSYAAGDDSSLSPLRAGRSEKQRIYTPRNAMHSLRQHMTTSSKSKHKRGVLKETVENTHDATQTPVSPEVFNNEASSETTETRTGRTHVDTVRQQPRKSSVARSLVGSLRSLGKRSGTLKPTSPGQGNPPRDPAATNALPSSPIDIPTPVLHLEFSDNGNISTHFINHSPGSEYKRKLMMMTDPSNHAPPARVPTYYTRLPGEGPGDSIFASSTKQNYTTLEFGELLPLSVDDYGFSTPDRASTHPLSEDRGTLGNAYSPPLRPLLRLCTDNEEGRRRYEKQERDIFTFAAATSPGPLPRSCYPESGRREMPEFSSGSIEPELEEALVDNYRFQMAMSGADVFNPLPGSPMTAAGVKSSGLSGTTHTSFDDGHFPPDANYAEPMPLGSWHQWTESARPGRHAEAESSALEERRGSNEYTFKPTDIMTPPEATLDDGLDLFQTYNATRRQRSNYLSSFSSAGGVPIGSLHKGALPTKSRS